jgi:hypothetical protein
MVVFMITGSDTCKLRLGPSHHAGVCMNACVCMYVLQFVYLYLCMFVCVSSCMYVFIYVCNVFMHACMYVCMHVYMSMLRYRHTYSRAVVNSTRINIHAYTHTCTHAQMHAWICLPQACMHAEAPVHLKHKCFHVRRITIQHTYMHTANPRSQTYQNSHRAAGRRLRRALVREHPALRTKRVSSPWGQIMPTYIHTYMRTHSTLASASIQR